jgi:surface polysaccharide O-acyltransferase-like enzyme
MERNSNFELLRLILMMMIVAHHCIVHGLSLVGIGGFDWAEPMAIRANDLPMFMIANSFFICAVNVFILISGYFGIHFTKEKLAYLLYMLFFYSILTSIGYSLFVDHSVRSIVRGFMAISHSSYWFVIDYLILMIFSPMINDFFKGHGKKEVLWFIVALLFISCYMGFFFKNVVNVNGYTFFQFIMIYCIGRYISIYKVTLKAWKSIPLYVIISFIIGYMMYGLSSFGLVKTAWKITFYNNPLLVLSAIFLFLTFRSFSFTSKWINKLSASALSIYLIQSSQLGEYYLYPFIRNVYTGKFGLQFGGGKMLLLILIVSVVIMFISVLFDRLPQGIYNRYLKNRINRFV